MIDRFVYFAERDGLIKIGCSALPRSRTRNLGAHLIITIPGDFALERALHHRFAGSQAHGEWFHPTFDLLAFVSVAPAMDPPDAVWTTKRAARFFSVGVESVRQWAGQGLIPAWRGGPGRAWHFSEPELRQWVEDHTRAASA